MQYILDHDLHIHSSLSSCSNDPEQTPENILKYAQNNGFNKICLTDHFWDSQVAGVSEWYAPQNYGHITTALPLPQSDKVSFYFGCETEMDKFNNLGIARETIDKFDFVIIPTTHLHMSEFTIDPKDYSAEKRAEVYMKRLAALLNMDLPFHKIGIAHLTCPLIDNSSPKAHIDIINLLNQTEFETLFGKAASLGVGIELNLPFQKYSEEELEIVMKPYRIAKQAGCKFYFGSDAHSLREFENKKQCFQIICEYLSLVEEDKFNPFR